METIKTALTVAAGMGFSLAIAILVEEWIFGKVFGLFLPGRSSTWNLDRSAKARKEELCCS
jgi:hypothetical protein